MLALYTNLSARLHRDEKGATAVEYGIMVALIAVVIIVAVTLLGGSLNTMFEAVKCQVGGGTGRPSRRPTPRPLAEPAPRNSLVSHVLMCAGTSTKSGGGTMPPPLWL